ncbi:hypothetical protein, partial [Streptomyces sp. A1547]|uniref:hypothetical protein n=1 Tax=Streptomyces sp. A1547 TaxID=2563105 RepID=UPI0019D13506
AVDDGVDCLFCGDARLAQLREVAAARELFGQLSQPSPKSRKLLRNSCGNPRKALRAFRGRYRPLSGRNCWAFSI